MDWNFDMGWGNTHEDIACVYKQENVNFLDDAAELITMYHPKGVLGWRHRDSDWTEYFLTKYFSCGMLWSKEPVLYGEFECELFLPDFRGSFPAFWLYNAGEGQPYNEIDWFEQFRKDRCLTAHKLSSGLIFKEENVVFNATQHLEKTTWHWKRFNTNHILKVRGYWFKNVIKWFINDKLVFEVTDSKLIPHQPLYVIVNGGVGNWKPKLNNDYQLNSVFVTTLNHNDKCLLTK